MEWLPSAIADIEREIEALDQRRGDYEHALGTLRKLVPAVDVGPLPRRGTKKSGIEARTDGRTDGANAAPARRAEPP